MKMTTESAWNDIQEKHEMAYFKGQLATEFPESYTVTSPMGNGTIPAVPAEAPKPKAFLEGYPDLLTPAHLSEITGMNVQYTRTATFRQSRSARAAGTFPRRGSQIM